FGCLGDSGMRFWAPLIAAGGEVRTWNPPGLASPFSWFSRDHRKLLVTDATIGFVGGLCISSRWLGDATRGIAPWRDTAVAVRGPALRGLANAFADNWAQCGAPLEADVLFADGAIEPAG